MEVGDVLFDRYTSLLAAAAFLQFSRPFSRASKRERKKTRERESRLFPVKTEGEGKNPSLPPSPLVLLLRKPVDPSRTLSTRKCFIISVEF